MTRLRGRLNGRRPNEPDPDNTGEGKQKVETQTKQPEELSFSFSKQILLELSELFAFYTIVVTELEVNR